jgi:hypothetical protein
MHSLFSFGTKPWSWVLKDMFVSHINVVLFRIDAKAAVGKDIHIFLNNICKKEGVLTGGSNRKLFFSRLKIMYV